MFRLENILPYLLAMQFPVVLFLAILTLQAGRAFKGSFFTWVSLGWFLNFFYLVLHEAPVAVRALADIGVPGGVLPLERLMVFLSGASFLIGARRHAEVTGALLARRLSDRAVLLIAFSGGLWAGYAPEMLSGGFFVALVAVPDVLFDLWTLGALALLLSTVGRRLGLSGIGGLNWLAFGAVIYLAVQPVHLLSQMLSGSSADQANNIGFLVGLLAKLVMTFGTVELFRAATFTAQRDKERSLASRTTVKRIFHELGTPVSEMFVHVDALLRRDLTQGQFNRHLHDLQSALLRVQAIMGASLRLNFLEDVLRVSGSLPPQRRAAPAVVRLNSAVQTAAMAVKETRDETVFLRYNYAGNCCLCCDEAAVVQILINVLRNAYDAFPKGKGTVSVATANVEKDEGSGTTSEWVRVTVADDGEGVRASLRDRIFEDGVSGRDGPGRGFGLGVARRLTTENLGSISIRSPLNDEGGTEVTVEFPRVSCP